MSETQISPTPPIFAVKKPEKHGGEGQNGTKLSFFGQKADKIGQNLSPIIGQTAGEKDASDNVFHFELHEEGQGSKERAEQSIELAADLIAVRDSMANVKRQLAECLEDIERAKATLTKSIQRGDKTKPATLEKNKQRVLNEEARQKKLAQRLHELQTKETNLLTQLQP
jgi:hypothetical protein